MPMPREYSASASLKQLQTYIRNAEQMIGGVTAIGRNAKGKTAVAFGADYPEIDTTVLVEITDGGPPEAPAGSVEVCRGEAFLLNKPAKIVVYRLSSA